MLKLSGVHRFIPNLKASCSDAQLGEWLPRAESLSIIGCYAQTELGHGSNVRGIETTATYKREEDEFEIHTPSLSAVKWWPGTLGRSATHAMVHARLILEGGKDAGVHGFIVQLRSLDTHQETPNPKP
ncbi:acyl-CoA dehydrogenase/oxidase [Baffinella frigidus]|nr:acyl-CoA dehydrogenase/oxidase [Cryptophyta sp. CCMP2293]